ncbi:acetylcholinesterase, putative [Ixodes scapularis]|uniref:Carboxylic ester hydrolase n=1 Tax=Ixodes scapularis TaxID=6945 RepID=B7QBJ1_IXOSC|nr:acetylcholinesterase, putative [Ixodes scapularis]|eukprot:XP_002412917.1 acetylcholinesterase, putative [Ixodes scapularis]
MAYNWWKLLTQEHRVDYVKLYVETLQRTVYDEDMSRPFLGSSPSNGILSELNEGVNDNPNDVLYGDVHYYDYYSPPWSLGSVPTPRFCSGFGLVSFPSFETLSTAFASEDLVFPFSQLIENRLHLGDKDVDAFYGIPYAKPPVGDLRFRKPQPAEPWNGTYEATTKPTACNQLDIRFIEGVTFNYQNASEDCLYVNVWRPSGICDDTESCDKILPVVVFIHGGGFQWGDSGLFIYDAANFVALSDVIFVSFNHRLSMMGFLSVGTSDLPGNLGFWDQLLALKWVRRNIARFGGNPKDVTLAGHSAGAVSAGIHAVSQQSKGLFHRLIMQSSTPLSLVLGLSYKGAGRFLNIAGKLNCYHAEKDWTTEVPNIMECLRQIDADVIFKMIAKQDPVNQFFSPVYGDEFIPADPLSFSTWEKIHVKEVLMGTTTDEGTLFVDNFQYAAPQLATVLKIDYRLAMVLALSAIFQIPVPAGKAIVREYFGDDEIEHDHPTVIKIAGDIVGDVLMNCPTDLFAEVTSAQGIPTHRYVFDHRPSYSLWPKYFGVAHADEIPFALGSLPFVTDTSRHTAVIEPAASKLLSSVRYTKQEENFMKQIVHVWSSFIKTGKMTVPSTNESWPTYTSKRPEFINLKPDNFTKSWNHRSCKLFRPFLLKK